MTEIIYSTFIGLYILAALLVLFLVVAEWSDRLFDDPVPGFIAFILILWVIITLIIRTFLPL